MNLEQRYLKSDHMLHDAWIQGLNDALEFIDTALWDKEIDFETYTKATTDLAIDIAFAYEGRLENHGDNLYRGTVRLSEASSSEDSSSTQDPFGRSAWAWENVRSLSELRASGSIQQHRCSCDSDSHTSGERTHGMDRHDREVREASLPAPQSSGPIIRQRRQEEQRVIFGPVRKWGSLFGRSGKPRRSSNND
jgi:hypothetical protein